MLCAWFETRNRYWVMLYFLEKKKKDFYNKSTCMALYIMLNLRMLLPVLKGKF